jgi:hypothetical protein
MRSLPSKIQRYKQRWYGEHNPRHIPVVIPASVLGQPEENVDVFVGTPSGKKGLHPNARVKMILIVPENNVMAMQGDLGGVSHGNGVGAAREKRSK